MSKEIKLTQDYVTIVDDDIYDYLNQWSWYAYVKEGKYIYATRSENGRTVWMHKEILQVSNGVLVDHKDGNGLNNQRYNLRESDRITNATNRRSKNSNNKTGYRNVCFFENKYIVQLQIDGKNTKLGSFDTAEEAGKFAKEMRKKYYGEFAGN
jgi:hypothetical protein